MATYEELAAEEVPSIERTNALVDAINIPAAEKEALRREMLLRRELHIETLNLAKRCAAGEEISYEALTTMMDEVAQRHGIECGLPLPQIGPDDASMDHPLVLAHASPLGRMTNWAHATESAERLSRSWRGKIRNSWNVLGDKTVNVVDSEDGPMWLEEPMAGQRLRKILADVGIRSDVAMTAEAELRAMESLKSKVKPNQYRTYVLAGAFFEHSKRSDLFYLFRKGRPTLAVSYHGTDDISKAGRVLCALCLHPTGYYQFSHVGTMTPSDEVISALLLMRADEHGFWKKSGQWGMADSRSGV